jgi:hypothetical protein
LTLGDRIYEEVRRHRNRIAVLLAALSIALLLVGQFQAKHRRSAAFLDWEPMPLVIGNEHDADRPYEGVLQHLSVWSKVLTPEQHLRRMDAVTDAELVFRLSVVNSAVIVHATGLPETLRFEQRDLPPGFEIRGDSLQCLGGRWVLPEAVATAVFESLRGQDELTIAARMTAEPHPGRKQGRILTLSNSALERCFTLGQSEGRVVFRVRSPASGHNAVMPQLVSDQPWMREGPIELLCSYSPHWMRIHVNGDRKESLLVGAMIRPNMIGRAAPLTLAVIATAASLAALGLLRSWAVGLFVQLLAAGVAIAAFHALAIDRHLPDLPWHLHLGAAVSVTLTLLLRMFSSTGDPYLDRSCATQNGTTRAT